MDDQQLANVIEAILFAAGEPLSLSDLKKVCQRAWSEESSEIVNARIEQLKSGLQTLRDRWAGYGDARGFELLEVAEGFTFRSNPRYSGYMRAMRDERPVRLSRAALETLAIVAYRQPATKPEVDHIRGVDCGGTLRMLLDRHMVRIVGKREEPGRPLLYGTTKEFLSFFNLTNLNELPSLREYHELNDESQAELDAFDGGPTLEELSQSAKELRLDEEPAVEALDQAVQELDQRESGAVDAFASTGISISTDEGEDASR
ncbi:MAG: SMC-Scp complex subunit ScpB [Myxococcota bacterium]